MSRRKKKNMIAAQTETETTPAETKPSRTRRPVELKAETAKKTDAISKALAATLKAKELQDRNVAIVGAILAGKNRKAVAAKHDVSPSWVHELLVAAGFKRPDIRNAERDAAIIADAANGKSPKTVAAETG
jgi:hypothetical protein